MKRILLLAAIFAAAGIANLHAQCNAYNLNIVIKSVTSSLTGCDVTLDVSFKGGFNNGNKYAFVHLWETAPVNNYPNLTYAVPPTAAELTNAIATIVIENPGQSNASLYNQYPASPGVPVKYSGISFSKTDSLFTMSNVVINFSTCAVPVTVKGDVWASQSNLSQTVHCENDGVITILFNNPIIQGIKQCATPRKLNLAFENEHATLIESVVASVFIDNNNNGSIDAGDIDITSALSPALPNPIILTPVSQQIFTGLTYEPYSSQPEFDTKPIIVRANATAPGAATVSITKNNINFLGSCSLLPVDLVSFSATRKGSTVKLVWQTAFEENNKGFTVERNINNTWSQVAFVGSQAVTGNSNKNLVYQFEDVNASNAVSQYRLKQIDIDGKFNYSEVRSVFGVETLGKVVVYPNPSNNGEVNVVLNGTGKHDLILSDMSGRVIKQWKGVSNNVQATNLVPGIYHLRVIDRETNQQATEKIVVSK